MRKKLLIATLMLLFSVLLFSCGGGGSPGSDSENTNINIQAVTVTATDSADVDVFQDTCDQDPEPFTRNTASLTITARAQNAEVNPFPAAVTACTITYVPAKPASPDIASWKIHNPGCIITNGTSECTVELIDIERKLKFAVDAGVVDAAGELIFPTPPPAVYRAHYDCDYQNNADEKGTFRGDVTIFLGEFDNC